jgi:hypothetical protein
MSSARTRGCVTPGEVSSLRGTVAPGRDGGWRLLHALENTSPRRPFNGVELRASSYLWIDESLIVRPTKIGKDADGFDVRALCDWRPTRSSFDIRVLREPTTQSDRESMIVRPWPASPARTDDIRRGLSP